MKNTSTIIVLFGQPGSGKTTLAEATKREIYRLSALSGPIIDGDVIRQIFKNNDYSKEGRIRNLNRISDIAVYSSNFNKLVFVSAVYPFREAREYLNSLHDNVIWVYLHYDGQRGRERYHVSDFEIPVKFKSNMTIINTSKHDVTESSKKICSFYREVSNPA